MRLLILFFLLISTTWSVAADPEGRLVVLVSFDQMRGDYPDRWKSLYGQDGFVKMQKEGLWLPQAYLPYACSSTGPGHATIGTGVLPKTHGIIGNNWTDPKSLDSKYCVYADRPYERVPQNDAAGVRSKTANGGLSPERLLVEGIGDELKRQTKGRVFSIALKDRAAVLMGGKHPDGIYCFDTDTGEFHTSSYYRDTLHPWVKKFNDDKVADQWFKSVWNYYGLDEILDGLPVTWPTPSGDQPKEMAYYRYGFRIGIQYPKTLEYNKLGTQDNAPGELGSDKPGGGNTFPHAISPPSLEKPGKFYYGSVELSPFGNDLVWQLAQSAIEAEKLGQGSTPDLLCLGFSSNDLVGHAWGPDSHEVIDMTVRSDALIASMIRYLNKTVGEGKFAIIITADHGICPLPESVEGKKHNGFRFDANSDIKPLGLALDTQFGKLDDKAGQWVRKLDYPWIHLNINACKKAKVTPEELRSFTASWLKDRPLWNSAYTREQLTLPTDDKVLTLCQNAYIADRCGDVLLINQPYSLPTGKTGTGTTHGSIHDYDRHVPVLAYGIGIPKAGTKLDKSSALIVAPLVCQALGITPPEHLEVKLTSRDR